MTQTTVAIGPVIRTANHYLPYCLFWYTVYYMLTAVRNCSHTNANNQIDTLRNSNPYKQKQSCRGSSVCGQWRHRCLRWQPHGGHHWPATLCKKKRAWLPSTSNQAKNTNWGCLRAWCLGKYWKVTGGWR